MTDIRAVQARAMQPNPGGGLQPEHVLGRDELIARYWATLRVRSLALLAPRRIGKTSIMVRMERVAPEGFVVVRRNLEGLESVAEFAQVLFDDVEQLLGRWSSKAIRTRELLAKFGVVELRNIKLEIRGASWKRLIERMFDDLAEQLEAREEILVLMWDEVTLFVAGLLESGRASEATAFLDVLRAARQRYTRVRMVLTGSIGFSEILRRLQRDHGYRNRPLNDVDRQPVPMLSAGGSEVLVCALLRHAKVELEPDLINTIVRMSEGHPFVIQLLVERLLQGGAPQVSKVEGCLARLLEPPDDALDLNHYLERLEQQLDPRAADCARAVLDHLAVHPGGRTRAELLASLADIDKDALLSAIRWLEDDFYLRRDESERLRFMFEFLRRFWRAERGL